MRDQRGQGTVEYIGLLFLLALVFAALALAGVPGVRAIPDAVVLEFRRALCVVGLGVCSDEQAKQLGLSPCVLGDESEERTTGATIMFVKGERGLRLLVERLSDGRVRVTQVDTDKLGAVLNTPGVDTPLVSLGASIGGGGALVTGRSWLVGSEAEAARLAEKLDDPDVLDRLPGVPAAALRWAGDALGVREGPQVPEPDDVVTEGGAYGDAGAAAAGGPRAGALADGLAVVGRRRARDPQTGSVTETTYFRAPGNLGAFAGYSDVRGTRSEGEELLSLVRVDGKPRELRVTSSSRELEVTEGRGAGGSWKAGVKGIELEATGRAVEDTVSLDLTDPAHRAAAERLLPPTPSNARTLGDYMRRYATRGRQAWAAVRSEAGGDLTGTVLPGFSLGGTLKTVRTGRVLESASVTTPDGITLDREDCFAFAGGK